MERRESSYTVGGNVNWYSHYGEQYGYSLKKLKIELPYDPAIPLLDINPKKNNKVLFQEDCWSWSVMQHCEMISLFGNVLKVMETFLSFYSLLPSN